MDATVGDEPIAVVDFVGEEGTEDIKEEVLVGGSGEVMMLEMGSGGDTSSSSFRND